MGEKQTNFLKQLIVESALQPFLSRGLDREKIKILPKDSSRMVLGHYMVLISVSANGLHIFFKVHFNIDKVQELMRFVHGRENLESPSLTIDAVKEYANLVAGRIQDLLQKNNIPSVISLPVQLRGYDEIMFMNSQNTSSFLDSWEFDVDQSSMFHSIFIESHLDYDIKTITFDGDDGVVEIF